MPNSKITIGSMIVIGGCGALYAVIDRNQSDRTTVFSQAGVRQMIVTPEVHSAAWYLRHPDILKQDEQRCAGNAGMMTPAACQNVASADAQLAGADYANAAAAFNASAGHPKSTSKPQ